mmetsp:Transcript_49644/g.91652  ORF Transcript_49644/g.91652 Transcript_49644/m.91652 type:complete len:416 (+) Transcript_49644:89-1336(+)
MSSSRASVPLIPYHDSFVDAWRIRFLQQQLPAKFISLQKGTVISLLGAVGFLFLAIGTMLLFFSLRVVEHVVDYTDLSVAENAPTYFDIKVNEDMQAPIWIYYELDGFHQNHRRYASSVDEMQLRLAPHPHGHACRPWEFNPDGERQYYPCGLIAHSVFTDTYAVLAKGPKQSNFTLLELDASASTIAWKKESTRSRYHNMDPEGHAPGRVQENQEWFDMWLLKQFPPVECHQVDFTSQRFEPVTVATQDRTVLLPRRLPTPPPQGGGDKPETDSWENVHIELPKCKGYQTEHPECEFTKGGEPFACNAAAGYQQTVQSEWGVESPHFLVWMRMATYPKFRKAWAKISTPIRAGSVVRVHFTDEFETKSFGGRKAFVLSTSGPFGGRSNLGWIYLLVGAILLYYRCQGTLPGQRD